MLEIVPKIYLIENLRGGNVYLVTEGSDFLLIDTGLSSDFNEIQNQIKGAGFRLNDLKYILLTHTHGDHAGNAARLVEQSNAVVCAHALEVPYIEGTAALPARSRFRRFFMQFGEKVLFKHPYVKVSQVLEDEEAIHFGEKLEVIHTPGHTPGSISLFQREQHVLFCGDIFFNQNPLTRKSKLQLAPPMLTLDAAQLLDSVRKLLTYPFEIICFGHGQPIMDQAQERISGLL
jgi:glyoxylase-like metal-dependent hydrolase (beta-lactamase superfamily II)